MSLSLVPRAAVLGALVALAAAVVAVNPAGPRPAAAQPIGNTIELVFSYGSEKQSWLEEVTAAFNAGGHRDADGRVIRVKLVAMGSGECMSALLEPEAWEKTAVKELDPVKDKGKGDLRAPAAAAARAHLTSPASGAFLVLAEDEAQIKKQKPLVDLAATKSLVTSPVVIAMWKPMAEALGWKPALGASGGVPEVGWKKVLDLAADPRGWKKVDGGAKWGRFKFVHTNPNLSNSGLISVLAETYAGAKKTGKGENGRLALADVDSKEVRAFVSQIEKSVVFYGQSTGFLARQMVEGGPDLLSAAVLYESDVIEANKNDRSGKKTLELPIVAVYPSEGTFWSDHPVGVVRRPWVTPAHEAAAAQYVKYLRENEQQERAMTFGFRPGEKVKLDPQVFSAQNGVDPLQPKVELEVPEADIMRAIKQMWKEVKKPLRVILVIDTSGSMKEQGKMIKAKAGAIDFIKLFGEQGYQDELSILAFSDDPYWVLPDGKAQGGKPLLMNKAGVKKATEVIEGLTADGQTSLYDAVEMAFLQLKEEQQKVRDRATAIIVLTDGVDEGNKQPGNRGSNTTLAQLLPLIKYNPELSATRVFTIAYGAGASKDVLGQISKSANALQYDGTPQNIAKILKQILEEQ